MVGVKHVQEQIIASGCTGDDNTKAIIFYVVKIAFIILDGYWIICSVHYEDYLLYVEFNGVDFLIFCIYNSLKILCLK